MALHELAINALKYGALSDASGAVDLAWLVDRQCSPPRLKLRWTERDGPPVAPPTRRGFGTRLIERSLTQDPGCEARIEFAPAGVVCMVDNPLTEPQASATPDPPQPRHHPPGFITW
jgi:two-component sensor histidine kinase